MPFIAPFRALRYNLEKISTMEEVVTPPYDVIDAAGHAKLLEKNPYNMIKLDLSKNFTRESLTEARYQGAKQLFEQWQQEQVLKRDERPAIYLYNVEYTHPSGQRLTRKGLVGLVRLSEFSEGVVKPHEKTFREVTTDRLRLLDTCNAQFSQIFSFYSDPVNEVMQILEAAAEPGQLCAAHDAHGNLHALRRVIDPAAIARVQQLFAGRPVYIADGHHRYTTALQMRELVRERQGKLAEESPFNHTMMYLCCMEDPGLSVLPTHRLVRWPGRIGLGELQAKLADGFEMREIAGAARETLLGELLSAMEEGAGRATMLGMYHPREDRCLLLTVKPDAMDRHFGGGQGGEIAAPLRELDVVVLSELLLDRYLGLCHGRCETDKLIDYFSDPDEGLDVAVKEAAAADNGEPLLFLMNPTLVAQVQRIADAGLVMPHKSTFFYPKILTGLLINQLVAGEKVGA